MSARPVAGVRPDVRVDGSPISDALAANIQEFIFEDSVHVPDLLELRFADPNRAYPAGTPFAVGKQLEVKLAAPGIEPTTFKADITGLIAHYEGGVYTLTVRAVDQMNRLHRGRWTKTYEHVTASDVFSSICGDEGLSTGKVDSTDVQFPHLSIVNESHYAFLKRLARDHNRVLVFADGKISFIKPPSPASEEQLSPQSSLIDLDMVITAAHLTPNITARGWDSHNKKAVEHTATVKASGISLDKGGDPQSLSSKLKSGKAPSTVISSPTFSDTAAATAAAEAAAETIGGGFVEIQGTAVGNPKLRAGSSIKFVEMPDAFLGKFVLSGTRHVFNMHEGYVTEFTVSSTQDRSILASANGGATGFDGQSTGPRGVVPAVVTDNKDPDNLGRVRVSFPWADADHVSQWSRTLLLGGGKDRGITFLPSVDDEVLVAFEDGNPGRPIVLGGLHSGKDAFPDHGGGDHTKSGAVQLRGLYTDKQQVAFVDKDGKESLSLGMRDKSYVVSIDKGQTTIKVTSDGKVEISAKDKVMISSKSDVVVTASSKLSFEAQGAVSIKGVGVEIVDTAGASLKLQGTAALKGATVAIN